MKWCGERWDWKVRWGCEELMEQGLELEGGVGMR